MRDLPVPKPPNPPQKPASRVAAAGIAPPELALAQGAAASTKGRDTHTEAEG